jgi:hypothetical protein
MDSLCFTNSTWIFSGQKILGPTYSNFQPEKQFTIGYSLASGMTGGGSTNSISGEIVDGYTTLNYPLLSDKIYAGNLSYQIEIGLTGSSFSATGSVLYVGGDGIAAKNLVVGNGIGRGKITIGGFFDGLTYSVPPINIVNAGICIDGSGNRCRCWTSVFNFFRRENADCNELRFASRAGAIGPVGNTFSIAPNSVILESPIKSDVENNITFKANLEVGSLLLGVTSSTEVAIAVIPRFGVELEEWQPDLMLYAGRRDATVQSPNSFQVGLGIYNVSTSHFEIAPSVYTSSTTNIHMYGTWSDSGTHSTLIVESDAVSVNKLFFGATNGQSIYVSGGDLYVNDVVFSGGTSSGTSGPQGETGPQGFDGLTGSQGETGPQGFDGVTGPQGETGPQGSNGANGSDGPNSIRFIFGDTSGSAPTATGSFNTSGGPSFSDVTSIHFNTPPYTDLNGSDITNWFDNIISDRNANRTINAQISEVGSPSNYGIYTVIPNNPSPNVLWDLTFVSGNGTFSTDRIYTISVVSGGPRGVTGSQGATGPAGTQLIFQGAWETLPAIYGADEYVTYGGSTWFTNAATDGIPPSPTNSNWTLFGGSALIVGTSIPNNSSSPGSKGEIRVDSGQYLYIHTGAQWLKSSMTFSTF